MQPLLLFLVLGASPMSTPIVIAHRGASGYLPEHTLEAKVLAHAMGADFLEQDVVLSKDGVPVVLHDVELDTVTDVARRFPGRARRDGRHYAIDFTLAELRELRVSERIDLRTGRAAHPGRFPTGASTFRIATLEEELELIAGLNRTTRRVAGVYPEIKRPGWHREQGQDISVKVLEVLRRHGYRTKQDACWLQCFEYPEVRRLRNELGWEGRLVQLLGSKSQGDNDTDFSHLRSRKGLAELAQLVDGIGPSLLNVIEPTANGHRPTSLVADAHAVGLAVHPYTAQADHLPVWAESMDVLLRAVLNEAGADGLFIDHPDLAVTFVRAGSR